MGSYSSQETYAFTRKLYKLLRHHGDKIFYRKLRGRCCGQYQPDTEEITLDYRREVIPTLIHESLHHFYPDKPETWVYREESKIINSLSQKQIKNIIRAMANAL